MKVADKLGALQSTDDGYAFQSGKILIRVKFLGKGNAPTIEDALVKIGSESP